MRVEGEIKMEVRLTFCDEVDRERYEICSGNLAYDWIVENGSAISEMRGIHN